jgi:hypothetical protein
LTLSSNLHRAVLALLAFLTATAATSQPIRANGLVVSSVTGYAVYADTPDIATTLEASTDRPYPFGGEVDYWNCGFGPAWNLTLTADGSAFVPDFGRRVCGPRIAAVRVTASNANVSTFVVFKSGGRRTTGYEIPLLTQPIADTPIVTEIRPVTNPADGSFSTALLLFNTGTSEQWVTATIYDDARTAAPTREFILTRPHGELTWYDIQTRFDSGRIELTPGYATLGCGGCPPPSEVYGFAAIGTPFGDAPRVREIAPKKGVAIWVP